MKTGDEVDETDINWKGAHDRARLIVMSADEAAALIRHLDENLIDLFNEELDLVSGDTRQTGVEGYIVIKVVP
jgi:hypothetical protein